MREEVKIIMAGLAHGHGVGFLKEALKEENVKILGFFDGDRPGAAEQASKEFGAKACESLEELFDLGGNTLLTARINNEKPEYIIEALKRGIGVVADKPMATTLEDLERIENAVEESGAPLYLMLTERFDPAVYTAKTLISRGEIGTVAQQHLVRPHRLRPENRPDWMFVRSQYGGIINDIGVHDFDLARHFADCEITQILSACVSNMRFPQYEDFKDCGTALCLMENGGSATVCVNWLTPDAYPAHGDTRFFITGTAGAIDVLTVGGKVRVCTDKQSEYYADIVRPPLSHVQDALYTMANPEHKPYITAKDAIESTRSALLAQAAAEAI